MPAPAAPLKSSLQVSVKPAGGGATDAPAAELTAVATRGLTTNAAARAARAGGAKFRGRRAGGGATDARAAELTAVATRGLTTTAAAMATSAGGRSFRRMAAPP